MNDQLATYTFLPWLRQGIANQVSGHSGNRATIPIELIIKGKNVKSDGEQSKTISKDIRLIENNSSDVVNKSDIPKLIKNVQSVLNTVIQDLRRDLNLQ